MLRGSLCLRRPAGLLAPRVVTPMELFGWVRGPSEKWAGRTARIRAWTEVVLSEPGPEEGSPFPCDPGRRDFAWALGVGRSLCEAQDLLAEGGLTFSTAREAAGDLEPDLWVRLARWEERYRAILRRSGLRDPTEGRLEALEKGVWRFAEDSVALVGCPDPHPLALRLLQAVLPDRACSVWIHAPETIADGFDEWGRPQPAFWQSRRLPFPATTRIEAEEGQVALRAALLVEANRIREAVTIGVCASRLLPYLRLALAERKIPAFDPGGVPGRESSWLPLLADIRELLEEGSLAAFRRLLCHPAAGWLGVGPGESVRALLEAFDRAAARSPGKDFRAAAREEVLKPCVERAQRFLSAAGAEPLAALRKPFSEVFGGERCGEGDDILAEELAAALQEIEALAPSVERPLGAAEVLALLIDRLSGLSLPEERPEKAVELRGWLELLWDDAPHLVLAGFQEGSVPESVTHHFLLPPALRERLGLRTNAEREARDAYLFEAVLAQRRGRGRVDLLACRFTREGEPLFPSRLLFRCPPEELPGRVRRVLDGQQPPPRRQPAATDSFLLRIGPLVWAGERKLSITGLRDYLACPFFFFLRHVRRWEFVEEPPEELNDREFGGLLHEVLADFGREEAMKGCDRREEMEDCLRDLLSRRLHRRFPDGIPPAIMFQAAALEGRLAGFARAQAEEVRRGWTTVSVEEPVSFSIGAWEIVGRIDRVDRDPDGRVRLLDFKSAERARSPRSAHLCPASESTGPEEAVFEWKGKRLRWRDLQLPLYAAAWRRRHPACSAVEVAYFALPRERAQAGILEWKEWSPTLETEAESCAGRVLRAVEEGRFWPPSESIVWRREPWRSWFDGRPGEIVSPVSAVG